MAFKDKQTKRERLSSIVSGDVRDRNRAGPSMVRLISAALSPRTGMPVTGLGANIKQPKIQSRVLPTLPPAAPKPKPKPVQVVSATTRERMSPVKATAPTRMAVNRATGDTTGFTTGTRTGSTATKAGVATRTSKTAMERMNQNAINKGSSAGPSKSGANRSTGGANRSTGGASRSTGNSLGSSGRGTGSKK